jgi:hypothetical protein
MAANTRVRRPGICADSICFSVFDQMLYTYEVFCKLIGAGCCGDPDMSRGYMPNINEKLSCVHTAQATLPVDRKLAYQNRSIYHLY